MELGKVIKSLNTGLNPRKFFQLNTPDAEFYYVTIKEMVNGKIVYNENTDRLNAEALRLCNNRSNLEKGDVLFTGTGTIGKTVVLTETPTTWNIKEGVYTIKPIPEKLDSNYLAFALSSTAIRSRYMTNVAGGTVKSLKMADLEKTEIPLPPLPDQQKIAAHLDSIQSAIDNKKQQLAQLDELVKSKFVEMFGENPVESGKWKVETLGSKSELITKGASPRWQGVEYQSEGTLFVTSENVREGYVDLTKSKYLPDEINEILPRSILKKNDVLINIVGASIGRAAIYEFEQKANINQAVALVRLNSSDLDKTFLLIYLNSELAMKLYQSMIKGGARDNLSLKNISDLSIPVPPIELQNTFAEYVQKIDSAKSIIKTQLEDLQELLDSKMDEYFGE